MANTSSYDIVNGNRFDNPTDDTTYVFTPSDTLKTFSLAGNADGDTVAISALSSDFKVVFKKNEMTLIGLKNTPSAGVLVKVQFDNSNGAAVNHIAFLDGTVDVSFTPNTPGALKGSWLFGGENFGKKVNLSNENVQYAIDSSKTYTQAAFDANGALNSESIMLTESVDHVDIPATNTFDTIFGVVDGEDSNGDDSTFSVGDLIEGNGNTNLRLAVSEAGSHGIDFATVKDVFQINFIAGESGTIAGNAGDWTDIGTVRLADGVDGLNIELDNLQEGTAIGLGANLSGDISATIDMGSSTVQATAELSANSDAGANSTLTVALAGVSADIASKVDAFAYIQESDVTKGLTIGDVAATLASGTAEDITEFEAEFSNSDYSYSLDGANLTVGDVNVGNIDVQMGDYGYAEVGAYNFVRIGGEDSSGSETLTGGDVTVGNVDVVGGDHVDVYAFITNNVWLYDSVESASVGNMSVGNVDIAVGDDSYVSVSVSNTVWASEDANLTAGNLKIEDISIAGGNDTSISLDIRNSASNSSSEGDVTVGNLDFGNITLSVGNNVSDDNYIDVEIENRAYAYSNGAATVGDLTGGNIAISVGSDVTNNVLSITNEAYIGYDSSEAAQAGNLKLGDISLDLGSHSTIDVNINNYAYGYDSNGEDSTAIVGDLEVGAIDVTLGIDASASISISNAASYADNETVGSMTLDGLTVTGDDGAYLYYYAYNAAWNGTGDVEGNTDFGGMHLTGGVSADYYAYQEVYADNGDIKGTVAFGDVDVSLGKNGQFTGYFYVTGENVSDVTMGSVSLSHLGTNAAWAGLYVTATATTTDGDVGTVTVGDVSLSAGESGSASFSVNVEATGKAGLLTLGDVTMTATGADADLNLWIGDTASGDLGNDGAVKVGDITVTVTSAVTKDAEFEYGFDVSIDTDDQDITIGDIKVVTAVGNDEVADNVGTLTTWLDLGANGGEITVGAIDYSGYKGEESDHTVGATIDVSAFDSVGTITGSSLDDSITDHDGKDVIYGGAGADLFTFVSGNSGKTTATVDQIMDWSSNDTIEFGFDLDVNNYDEEDYDNFAAFTTDAEALSTSGSILVGKVGSNLFVAVDGNGGGYDYVIQLVGVNNLNNIDAANFV